MTVEVKAVRVDDCMEVAGGKRKQDILVGDASGSMRQTVWEAEVGKVKEKVEVYVDIKGELQNRSD